MSDDGEELILRLADTPSCGVCGGPTLLAVQFPHSWKNASGEDVHGLREAVLCRACGGGEPAADALLTYFAVHGQVDVADETFVELLAAWVESVRRRKVDQAQLDDEMERWLRGDL